MPTISPFPLAVHRSFTVVDCETTGRKTGEARVVEVAAVRFRNGKIVGTWSSLVNPGCSIPPGASAIHLLISEDVADAPALDEVLDDLAAFVADDVVVAHHAEYDRALLPSLQDHAWLCTLRLSRHLHPDFERHTNQAVRFELAIGHHPALRGGTPHRATYDCITTGLVLERLIETFLERRDPDATWSDLLAYAESPVPMTRLRFGKYFGRLLTEVALTDPGYLQWMLRAGLDLEPHEINAVRAALDAARAAA